MTMLCYRKFWSAVKSRLISFLWCSIPSLRYPSKYGISKACQYIFSSCVYDISFVISTFASFACPLGFKFLFQQLMINVVDITPCLWLVAVFRCLVCQWLTSLIIRIKYTNRFIESSESRHTFWDGTLKEMVVLLLGVEFEVLFCIRMINIINNAIQK